MVVSRLGTARAAQLTTDSGSSPDTDLIDEFIVEAEGTVMSAVNRRTATTISQADHPNSFATLRGKVMALVIYGLCGRRLPIPKDVETAHDQAVKWLDDLVAGKRDLPDAALAGETPTWGSETANAGREDMV